MTRFLAPGKTDVLMTRSPRLADAPGRRSLAPRPRPSAISPPSSTAICSCTSTTTSAPACRPTRRDDARSWRSAASSGPREAHRDRRGLPALESMIRDLRHGARTLRRNPGFAAGRHRHPRPRHRRQLRHLHRGQRRGAPAAAVPRRRPHRQAVAHAAAEHVCRDEDLFSFAGELPGLGSAERLVREDGHLPRRRATTLTGHGEPEVVIALRTSSTFCRSSGSTAARDADSQPTRTARAGRTRCF